MILYAYVHTYIRTYSSTPVSMCCARIVSGFAVDSVMGQAFLFVK